MKNTTYYLYIIKNSVNNKSYIGISKNPSVRKRQHWNYENRLKGSVNILYSAMAKYGKDSFTFEVICIGTRDYIVDLEIKAISAFRLTEKEFGYNLKPGGQVGLAGYTLKKTSKDKFHYVSGFWFPNVRTALNSLKMGKQTLLRRRKQGTLGDLVHKNLKVCWDEKVIYVSGFWWPNIKIASAVLSVKVPAIKLRISRGNIEQAFVLREQSGSANHMYGIATAAHPSSKPVEIDGKKYNSLKDAAASTGLSKYLLRKKIKAGNDACFT